MYQSLRETVNSKGKFIPCNVKLENYIKNEKDWYVSLYQYTEEQKKLAETKGTVSGIKDTTTDTIYFDFDSEENLELAREDAIKVAVRLIEKGVAEENIQAFFTGGKGYAIQIKTLQRINTRQFKKFTVTFAGDLETFDSTVSDANRIIRIPNTKHQKSGLYKIALELSELEEFTTQDVKTLARVPRNITINTSQQDISWFDFNEEVKKETKINLSIDIDFTKKPKGWSNCKWALCNGHDVKGGDRHYKLLTVIATSKALNYTQEQTYYLAKNAMKEGVKRNGGEEVPKEEIWTTVESVYSPTWTGGTFSCKDGKSPWLTELCESLGTNRCKAMDLPIVSASEVFGLFQDYALNFEKNVVKTGIDVLDEKCKFLVGTSNGILAPPGVGKTSFILRMLNHLSNTDKIGIFFSYDMYHSMVYLRLIQAHTGLNQDEIFRIFKEDKTKAFEIKETLEQQYSNIQFCFKSGQTCDEIQETILDTEQKLGKKVTANVFDYNELIITNLSDPTQSSAQTAQRLRQIANDTTTMNLTLLQPSKLYSNPADEASTYQAAKGSGAIAQSMSLMLSLSRPGFSPRNPENDRFLTVNALKNRQGALFTQDLHWEGLTGNVRELTQEEENDLADLRKLKEMNKDSQNGLS